MRTGRRTHRPTVLQTYLLGTLDFEVLLRLQRRLHFDISGDPGQAALLLCEHPPIITVGRQGSRRLIFFPDDEMRVRGWPVRWVTRGGGCILHTPGQLAVYPILPLDALELPVTEYLQRAGRVVSAVLEDFGVQTDSTPRSTGVFVRDRQVAAFGVAVRQCVSFFGFYFNIHPDLELYRGVRCTERSEPPMTSLERERHGPVRPSLVRQRLIEHFRGTFEFDETAIFSEHPLVETYMKPPLANKIAVR